MSITYLTIAGSTAVVPLTQGKFALIDVADLPRVEGKRWYARRTSKGWYAQRDERGPDGAYRFVHMHRVIAQPPENRIVDHINCDGLDNRRSNLRHATNGQNATWSKFPKGSSGYRGVFWQCDRDKWRAEISKDRKKHFLGDYDDPAEAARAYDAAAIELHGEFARPNFAAPPAPRPSPARAAKGGPL